MSSGDVVSVITSDTRVKVSSTLDKSVGKKYLTDGSPETCWTSQQGLPQSIQLLFPSPIVPHRVLLTFQGGFVGTRCTVQIQTSEGDAWEKLTQIYPEDVNRAQAFNLQEVASHAVQGIKLVFEESSDFFGRITVYDLNIEGEIVGER